MSLREFFARCPDSETAHGSITVQWARKDTGFGEFTIYVGEDGKVHFDTELMGPEFVRGVLSDLVDHAIFDDFKDRTPLKVREASPVTGGGTTE